VVKPLVLETGIGSSVKMIFEISDLGAFPIMSKFESRLAGTSTRGELKDIILR